MVVQENQANWSMILLDRRPKRAAMFAGLHPHIVSNAAGLRDSVTHASKNSMWVSYAGDLTAALVSRASAAPASLGVGLFVHPVDLKSIPVLSSMFRRIAFAVDGGFIPADELAEVLGADHRADLFIGGYVNRATKTVTFWRGDLRPLTVPFAAFEKSGAGAEPDFDALSVIDCGQTVQLGEYEAAVDAILYEYDPDYRRALTQKRRQADRTFGAALRRLRKQRGLRQEDFEPDLSARTIARIEQGEVRRIQKHTLAALAQHLAVKPEEIGSY